MTKGLGMRKGLDPSTRMRLWTLHRPDVSRAGGEPQKGAQQPPRAITRCLGLSAPAQGWPLPSWLLGLIPKGLG
jgi:hypothetical protein